MRVEIFCKYDMKWGKHNVGLKIRICKLDSWKSGKSMHWTSKSTPKHASPDFSGYSMPNGALFWKIFSKCFKGKLHRFEGFPAGNNVVFQTTGDPGQIFFVDYGYLMVTLNVQIHFKIGDSSPENAEWLYYSAKVT